MLKSGNLENRYLHFPFFIRCFSVLQCSHFRNLLFVSSSLQAFLFCSAAVVGANCDFDHKILFGLRYSIADFLEFSNSQFISIIPSFAFLQFSNSPILAFSNSPMLKLKLSLPFIPSFPIPAVKHSSNNTPNPSPISWYCDVSFLHYTISKLHRYAAKL